MTLSKRLIMNHEPCLKHIHLEILKFSPKFPTQLTLSLSDRNLKFLIYKHLKRH